MNLTAAPLKPDNDRYPSQPFLDRRTGRRVLLAVVISVALHLLLFFVQAPVETPPERPRVFHAELQTEIAQRDDGEDRRGDITDESPATVKPPADPAPSAPQSTDKTANQTPAELITATSSPVKTQEPSQQPDIQQPVVQQKASESEQTVTIPEKKPVPQKRPEPEITAESPQSETSTPAPPSSLQTQGDHEEFSDPLERAYYELLVAHLNARLPAHPKGIAGKVRLEIKIQYGSVITGVNIIDSSGNAATDSWARKAALSVSPVPPVPEKFAQPYFFRPTLLLTP